MVISCVKKTILDYDLINKNMHIVIGLSGGPDSVCLFHVLNHLKEQMGIQLYGVHINHQFRPGAAEEDQKYVQALCCRCNIPFYTFTYDCTKIAREEGISGEEAGRKVRYQSFVSVARQIAAQGTGPELIRIAVAQNADDQAETILFRILRGTGTDGLSGISYKRKEAEFQVIRPLLDVYREDIMLYCQHHDLNPRIDKTNLQPIYTRNKIRLNLLPYLETQFNEKTKETLNRLSKIAREDKDYLWQQAEAAYEEISNKAFSIAHLNALHPAIRHRVIMKVLRETGMEQDLTRAHISAIDDLLQQNKTSKSLDLPNGFQIRTAYGKMQCSHMNETTEEKKWRLKISLVQPETERFASTAVFDWDKIKREYENPQIMLRFRQPGDYIRTKAGRKKIQDLFVDDKVPREKREGIPMAAIGREILWIPSFPPFLIKNKYSCNYTVDKETKIMLLLETICEI